MAFDKVVDSERLDAALSATSKAIRTKTDNPDDLVWDMDTGFSDEVHKIQKAKPEQTKLVTPTKTVQEVTPDAGYVLNNVTVNPIPAQYADVSGVTAVADDVVYGKSIVGADGSAVNGTMHRRVYTGEIVSTVQGSSAYAVLAQSDFLAEHRNDETLFVRVEFDIEPIAYTVVKNWATNVTMDVIPINSATQYQSVYRWGSTGTRSLNTNNLPLHTDSPDGVGCLQITEDGELRCYSNSSNYAIRPSTYKVVVEW